MTLFCFVYVNFDSVGGVHLYKLSCVWSVVCQGFVSVHCQEKCAVEFHRDCWALQKSAVLDVRLDKVDTVHCPKSTA